MSANYMRNDAQIQLNRGGGAKNLGNLHDCIFSIDLALTHLILSLILALYAAAGRRHGRAARLEEYARSVRIGRRKVCENLPIGPGDKRATRKIS